MHIAFERTRDIEQRILGQKKHEREHVIQNRESTSRVHTWESRVYLALHLHLRHLRMAAQLPAGIFYCVQLRKIITPGNILSV